MLDFKLTATINTIRILTNNLVKILYFRPHSFKHPQILSQKYLIDEQIHSDNDLCIFIDKYNRKKI